VNDLKVNALENQKSQETKPILELDREIQDGWNQLINLIVKS
jgi:hypothetical protein